MCVPELFYPLPTCAIGTASHSGKCWKKVRMCLFSSKTTSISQRLARAGAARQEAYGTLFSLLLEQVSERVFSLMGTCTMAPPGPREKSDISLSPVPKKRPWPSAVPDRLKTLSVERASNRPGLRCPMELVPVTNRDGT